jgi:tetratricopeptide (TPR) repeat protein
MRTFIALSLSAVTAVFISFAPRTVTYTEKKSAESFTVNKNPGRAIKICGSINTSYIDEDLETPLFRDLGNHFYKVSTESAAAQKYFNQGLTLVYGFNHMEALRSFRQATKLDPELAMAYWGQALCWGPNINLPMSDEYGKLALEAIQKARELKIHCNEKEQDLIDALAARYSADTMAERTDLDRKYAEAMKGLRKKYNDDLDIKTLYAAALMNTMPWDYYIDPDNPKPESRTVIEVLEEVLDTDMNHPGANHYYIHIVEPSTTPERGLPSADRLGNLVPGSGHLVHMPSHIYIRTGLYQKAINSNLNAILSDEEYIAQCQASGVYPGGYYPHNIHFLYASSSLAGNREMAISAARKVRDKLPSEAIDDSYFTQEFLTALYHAYVIFGAWNEILTEPAPSADHLHALVVWHYSRGIAFMAKKLENKALGELEQLKNLIEGETFMSKYPEGSETYKVGQIALNILTARHKIVDGNIKGALENLALARTHEDALNYNEPATWSLPVRWIEGAVLLKDNQPGRAENIFREDLAKNRDNGWALHGLAESLKAQDRQQDVKEVEKLFKIAWQWADVDARLMYF